MENSSREIIICAKLWISGIMEPDHPELTEMVVSSDGQKSCELDTSLERLESKYSRKVWRLSSKSGLKFARIITRIEAQRPWAVRLVSSRLKHDRQVNNPGLLSGAQIQRNKFPDVYPGLFRGAARDSFDARSLATRSKLTRQNPLTGSPKMSFKTSNSG